MNIMAARKSINSYSHAGKLISFLSLVANVALLFLLRDKMITTLGGGFGYSVVMTYFFLLYFFNPALQFAISLIMAQMVILIGLNYLAFVERFGAFKFDIRAGLIIALLFLFCLVSNPLITLPLRRSEPSGVDETYYGQHRRGLITAISCAGVIIMSFVVYTAISLRVLRKSFLVESGIFQVSWLALAWTGVAFTFVYVRVKRIPSELVSYLVQGFPVDLPPRFQRYVLFGWILLVATGTLCEGFRGFWFYWAINLFLHVSLIMCIRKIWGPVLARAGTGVLPERVKPLPDGSDARFFISLVCGVAMAGVAYVLLLLITIKSYPT